jgi:hypothetical protein
VALPVYNGRVLTVSATQYSRVPLSLLNPEGETPMFCVSSGGDHEFRHGTEIRGIREKIDQRLVKWVVLTSSARNSGYQKVTDMTTKNSALSSQYISTMKSVSLPVSPLVLVPPWSMITPPQSVLRPKQKLGPHGTCRHDANGK